MVKTGISLGKKITTIALALVYVFAASTYVLFLSSRTHTYHHHRVATSAMQHLSSSRAAGNFYDKQHGAFKSTFLNKRKVIGAIYRLVCLVVFELVASLWLLYADRLANVVTGLMYAGRPWYLSLRVLRI
jgi:hypothetical protein